LKGNINRRKEFMQETNQQETDIQKEYSFWDVIESGIIGFLYVAMVAVGIVFIMGIGGMLYRLLT
jgi:hypothetical protein